MTSLRHFPYFVSKSPGLRAQLTACNDHQHCEPRRQASGLGRANTIPSQRNLGYISRTASNIKTNPSNTYPDRTRARWRLTLSSTSTTLPLRCSSPSPGSLLASSSPGHCRRVTYQGETSSVLMSAVRQDHRFYRWIQLLHPRPHHPSNRG